MLTAGRVVVVPVRGVGVGRVAMDARAVAGGAVRVGAEAVAGLETVVRVVVPVPLAVVAGRRAAVVVDVLPVLVWPVVFEGTVREVVEAVVRGPVVEVVVVEGFAGGAREEVLDARDCLPAVVAVLRVAEAARPAVGAPGFETMRRVPTVPGLTIHHHSCNQFRPRVQYVRRKQHTRGSSSRSGLSRCCPRFRLVYSRSFVLN